MTIRGPDPGLLQQCPDDAQTHMGPEAMLEFDDRPSFSAHWTMLPLLTGHHLSAVPPLERLYLAVEPPATVHIVPHCSIFGQNLTPYVIVDELQRPDTDLGNRYFKDW